MVSREPERLTSPKHSQLVSVRWKREWTPDIIQFDVWGVFIINYNANRNKIIICLKFWILRNGEEIENQRWREFNSERKIRIARRNTRALYKFLHQDSHHILLENMVTWVEERMKKKKCQPFPFCPYFSVRHFLVGVLFYFYDDSDRPINGE